MKGKGQYVYASCAGSKSGFERAPPEPLFKFNNGHFGGSHACVDSTHAALAGGNQFAGSALFALKPALLAFIASGPHIESL